jgi:hypothetical protein
MSPRRPGCRASLYSVGQDQWAVALKNGRAAKQFAAIEDLVRRPVPWISLAPSGTMAEAVAPGTAKNDNKMTTDAARGA